MIQDNRGRTPRFVLVEDPDGDTDNGDRLMLNQHTGNTAPCNTKDKHSMIRATRRIDERRKPDGT